MTSKDIKNRPGLRRPPLNPKGGKHGRSGTPATFTLREQVGPSEIMAPEDDPAWGWFMRIFVTAMVVAMGVVIANAYQYYKRPYVTYTVSKGEVVTSVYAKGQVEPKNIQKMISLLPDIAVVNKVNAKVGDLVKRGTLVFEISDKILLSRILESSQLVDYQRMLLRGAQIYLREGRADQKDVDERRLELQDAERRMDFYVNFLPDTKIHAELSGYVLRLDVEPDDVIKPGQLLMWLGEASPRWVMLEMEENLATKISPGDEVRLYVGFKGSPKIKDYTESGTVSKIVPPLRYKELPFEEDTYEVYVDLAPEVRPQPEALMPVSAEILNRRVQDVTWVNYRSIYKYTYVLVKKPDGTVEARYVELGEKGHRGKKVEVISGVEPGEEVLSFPEDYVSRFGDIELPGAG